MLSIEESRILRWFDGACARSATLSAWRTRASRLRDRLWEDPGARPRTLRALGVVGAVLLPALGIGAWLALRPVPKPDYRNDSIARVLDYTFLTSEFNRLPVEERLRLIGFIRERIESMSAGESLLLAAFAAGIRGEAREQLEENISRLMIDVWDRKARSYASVPSEERGDFLDGAFIEMYRLMETVSGEPSEQTDSEVLAEGREQARRDLERVREGEGPGARAVSRLYSIMVDGVGGHASPQQRARGRVMMTDMIRRLRGGGG